MAQQLYPNFLRQKVKYRKLSYSGKGRPKKTDYIILERGDVMDYQAAERLLYCFSVNYTPK